MTKLHLSTLWPATVGFDHFSNEVESLLNQAETTSSFPPHNIIKVCDNYYVVELAVAGFSKDEISINIVGGILEIKGVKNNQDKDVQYLHKGIGARSFTKTIRLAETIEVRGAQFQDGILSIGLENVIPEHKKPRSIEIKDDLNFYKPEFLTE